MKEKRLLLTSLKQTCNENLIKFSENQSAPCAPNLLNVLVSRILGYHNLCSPASNHCLPLSLTDCYCLDLDGGMTLTDEDICSLVINHFTLVPGHLFAVAPGDDSDFKNQTIYKCSGFHFVRKICIEV